MYVCKWLGKIARYKAEHTHEMTLPISQQHAITQLPNALLSPLTHAVLLF